MEEDIKVLERLIERYYNIPCGNHICPTEIYYEEIEAIENLIARNKELEEERQYEKELRLKYERRYKKFKKKNKEYENKIKAVLELIDTKPYTAYTLYGDILYDDENIKELLEERN